MSFYEISKEKRQQCVSLIHQEILQELRNQNNDRINKNFSDEDTYIRKAAYQAFGKIYLYDECIRDKIISQLKLLMLSENEKIRQTAVNAAGEIGMKDFTIIERIMETGLFDTHHIVKNAVIGSIKKMIEKNPLPVLKFARKFLYHENPEIRREICHGIELRGRTHPQDILPLLEELQFEVKPRVRNTLIHVLGQISYKKNCLETVVNHLKYWENKDLVVKVMEEIIDVHDRYKNFAVKTQHEAISYIDNNLN
ncbi:MAG: HEAT repeat domain-containing protein [Bacteroidota bacterium]|nr:HEAT repeat domain-containing protein [Bacteroidota bacterium]